ncbi:MAG: hypothetical protein JW742_02885 [Candidatus Aminicenantes bacterium]|nr:hypothetical protein [Candidatus Aminicenantes bacterium]
MQSVEDTRFVFRRTVVMGAAICASLLVYVGIVELMRAVMKPFHGIAVVPLGKVQTLRLLIYGLAVASVIAIRLMRGRLLRVVPGEASRLTLMRLMRASVLTFILAELPALAGIVLFFATGLSRDFYILLFVSLVLEFMYFPRRAPWDDLLSRGGGAPGGRL